MGLSQDELVKRFRAAHRISNATPLNAAQLYKALQDASVYYYVDPWDGFFYYFSWESVLQKVSQSIPYEGLTEPGLVEMLQEEVMHCYPSPCIPIPLPSFSIGKIDPDGPSPPPDMQVVAPSEKFGAWIFKYFFHLLFITRSVRHRECLLYYSATQASILRPFTRHPAPLYDAPPFSLSEKELEEEAMLGNVFAALAALERDKLPVWTSFDEIVRPLLEAIQKTRSATEDPCRMEKWSTAEWHRRLKESKVFQQHFDWKPAVDFQEVSSGAIRRGGLRKCGGPSKGEGSEDSGRRGLLILDGTSLSKEGETEKLIRQAIHAAMADPLPVELVLLLPRRGMVSCGGSHLTGFGEESKNTYLRAVQQQLGEGAAELVFPVSTSLRKEGGWEGPSDATVIPVDELLDAHHVVGALLNRLSQGQAAVGSFAGSHPRIIMVCGDSAVNDMKQVALRAWKLGADEGEDSSEASRLDIPDEVLIFSPTHLNAPVRAVPITAA